MNGRSLTSGTPWRLIASFALPVLLSLLLQQLYSTADAIILSNFAGESAFAAVGVTTPLNMFFLAIANGFSAGAGVVAAQFYGANRMLELRKTASTAILCLLVMGAISTILGIAGCRTALVRILAVSDSLREMSVVYFRVLAAGFLFQFGYNVISALLRAVGDSRASIYFLLIASVLNVLLDLLFVAVFKWSTGGAAFATILAQAGSCFAALIYSSRKYPVFRWRLSELSFERRLASLILRAGFPMALQQAIVSLGNLGIQRAVNGYGDSMVASFSVAQRIEPFLTMPIMSFQVTMATYVGQNIGAGKMNRVMSGARQSVIMSEACTLLVSAATFLSADVLASIFNLGEESVSYCVQHLRCTAIIMLIIGAYFPLLGLFQGANDGFAATIVGTTVLAVRVLCTYTLCNLPMFGYRIVWWNQLFGFICGFTVTWTHFLRGKWKNKSNTMRQTI